MDAQLDQEGRGVADHGGLNAFHVRMEPAEACSLARDLYGLEVVADRLATEKDDTFRLSSSDRGRFILKVANPAESTSELEFEMAMLQDVRARDPGLPIPSLTPDVDGEMLATVTDAAGQTRHVRLLSYIEGAPIDRMSTTTAALRRDIGQVLARLRLALADFDHPAADRVLAWDVRNLLGLAPGLNSIPDPVRRAQVERAVDRFAEIQPAVERLRRQVLHNDFNTSNLIVDTSDPDRLAGVIDFGDAVRTAIAIDVSTALLNQLPRNLGADVSGDMFAAGRDLLAGYLELAELTPDELSLLPHLVMARVAARAIITYGRAALFPDNVTYIMRNTEQGWAQLDWFLTRSPDQVSVTFLDAPFASAPNLEKAPT